MKVDADAESREGELEAEQFRTSEVWERKRTVAAKNKSGPVEMVDDGSVPDISGLHKAERANSQTASHVKTRWEKYGEVVLQQHLRRVGRMKSLRKLRVRRCVLRIKKPSVETAAAVTSIKAAKAETMGKDQGHDKSRALEPEFDEEDEE